MFGSDTGVQYRKEYFMKRGLSLITSLMMTASVFGGAVSQAISINNVAVVSAADAKPVMNVGKPEFAGTTMVPAGAKKVSIPVSLTSSDLLAMIVKVEVKADKAGAADPVITGFSEDFASVTPDEKASNTRSFIWTNGSDIKAPELKDKVVTNIEIELPEDVKEDSTYTVKVLSIDPSNVTREKGYTFDDASDLTEKIAIGSVAAEDYTLKFAENKDGKWTEAEKIFVEPGKEVSVGLEIQSPKNSIGAIVFDYDLDERAQITGFEKGKIGEVDPGENNNLKAVWTIPGEFNGYDFKDETHLYTIKVAIPSDAKEGDVFTLKLKDENTSTGDRQIISPVKLPVVDLVVGQENVDPPKSNELELTIDTVTVPFGTKTVEVPVYAKNGEASAVIAYFEAQKEAKIVDIKEAAVPGEVSMSEKDTYAVWTTKFSTSVDNYKFGEEAQKLFMLTVELPDNATGEYPIVFGKKTESSDNKRTVINPVLNNGAVIVDVIETETTTEEPEETTEPVPVYTTGPVPVDTTVSETTPVPVDTTVSETTPVPVDTTVSETTPVPVDTTVSETTPVPVDTTVSETTEPVPVDTTVSETTPVPVDTTVSETTKPVPVETTVSETTPVPVDTTVSETTSETTVTSVTTTSEPPVTTVTTEPEPVQTTSNPPAFDYNPKDPIVVKKFNDNVNAQVFPEDYKPEFYYEHEKEFTKIADDFSATVVLEKFRNVDAETKADISFKLTKDNIVFPDAEKFNPHTVYDGTKFKYTVTVTLNVDSIKDEQLIDYDGKQMNAELAQEFKDILKGQKVEVQMPVMIGLLGDFDLSHSVLQTDATFILREMLSLDMKNKSIVKDEVLKGNDAAFNELKEYGEDYVVEFANFLGDTDMDGQNKQVDATFILRAILENDFSGAEDKTRISEEIWKKVGVFD